MHTKSQIKIKELALRQMVENFTWKVRRNELDDVDLLMYNIESLHEMVRELKHERTIASEEKTIYERFMKESHEELDSAYEKIMKEPGAPDLFSL